MLSRKVGRPKLRRIDKAFLAACSRVVPRHRWGSFIVAPSTLLRWHRELVRRKWTFKHKRAGRPPIDPALAALISRMARENPRWGYPGTRVDRYGGPGGTFASPEGTPFAARSLRSTSINNP